MERQTPATRNLSVRIRLREFSIPPITDALVLGKRSPIGSEAIRRALSLLHVAPFEHLTVEDDTVEDVLVRASILKKIPRAGLIDLILRRVKPFMATDEVIHLDLAPELVLEDQI